MGHLWFFVFNYDLNGLFSLNGYLRKFEKLCIYYFENNACMEES